MTQRKSFHLSSDLAGKKSLSVFVTLNKYVISRMFSICSDNFWDFPDILIRLSDMSTYYYNTKLVLLFYLFLRAFQIY